MVAVLATAMASLMVLTSGAIPTSKDRDQQSVQARANLDTMEADLAIATSIIAHDSESIEFKVPDRTGDLIEETIKYEWDEDDNELTRVVNGGSKAVVLSSAPVFELTLTTDTRQEWVVSGTEESSEVVLASYLGTTDQVLTTNVLVVYAQFVLPLLDSDVTEWRLTKFRHAFVPVAGKETAYSATVHPPTASGWLNGLVTLDTTSNVPTGNAGETSMQTLDLSACTWRARDTGLWVAIRPGIISEFQLPAQSVAADAGYTGISSNLFQPNRNAALSYEALGRVRRPKKVATTVAYATHAKVRAELASGQILLIQARMWNQPEVP